MKPILSTRATKAERQNRAPIHVTPMATLRGSKTQRSKKLKDHVVSPATTCCDG